MSITLPAEWAPQRAVMLTWPRADGDFAHHFAEVEGAFIGIALAIARFEPVHINTGLDPQALRARLLRRGLREDRLRIFQVPSDDVWARDHGPITVFRDGQALHLDFRFNGWGGKFPAVRDDALTRRLAELGAWEAPVQGVEFVLEGGAIESDGAGTLLTTERCLLGPNRNPNMSKASIEALLKSVLGLRRVLWLKHGDLLGDDTDGHIDTLARFSDPRTLIYQACADRSDAHFEELRAMEDELRRLRCADGEPYRLVPLPLPAPIYDEDRRRLPAGYANFLIVNDAVLVPQYGVAQDAGVLQALRPYFAEREVVGVDCRSLIRQYGSLHCVTMQIPATTAPR